MKNQKLEDGKKQATKDYAWEKEAEPGERKTPGKRKRRDPDEDVDDAPLGKSTCALPSQDSFRF
jgi:hypothetical protein